jgi:hypothetical protein
MGLLVPKQTFRMAAKGGRLPLISTGRRGRLSSALARLGRATLQQGGPPCRETNSVGTNCMGCSRCWASATCKKRWRTTATARLPHRLCRRRATRACTRMHARRIRAANGIHTFRAARARHAAQPVRVALASRRRGDRRALPQVLGEGREGRGRTSQSVVGAAAVRGRGLQRLPHRLLRRDLAGSPLARPARLCEDLGQQPAMVAPLEPARQATTSGGRDARPPTHVPSPSQPPPGPLLGPLGQLW